jgi:SAM-dependent methyltransferase
MLNNKDEWDISYEKGDNFVFYPHEEIVRFISKYIRKRIGLAEFRDIASGVNEPIRVLDLGCGIGRHVIYCHEMGLETYGIDLSDAAINMALDWAQRNGILDIEKKIKQGDVRHLPWEDGFFGYAISHGVLDSMPYEMARQAVVELANKMKNGGLFYCDLISGDDSWHFREFDGEELIHANHEKGTIQSYFNLAKILSLFKNLFRIHDCNLVRRESILRGGYTSRYHLVLEKI